MKHFDGWLYAMVAIFGSITVSLGTDEAYNLFSPQTLFWSKSICGAMSAGALAVKMYRSTTFAQIKSDSTPDSTVITETRKESVPPVMADKTTTPETPAQPNNTARTE
jgi:hypothetical protein